MTPELIVDLKSDGRDLVRTKVSRSETRKYLIKALTSAPREGDLWIGGDFNFHEGCRKDPDYEVTIDEIMMEYGLIRCKGRQMDTFIYNGKSSTTDALYVRHEQLTYCARIGVKLKRRFNNFQTLQHAIIQLLVGAKTH